MAQAPISFEDLFSSLGPGARELQEFTQSVQGLSRNYKAFAKALDADAGRIATSLATLRESATGLKAQVAATSVGTDQQRTQISQLATEVARLAAEQTAYKQALEGQGTVRRAAKQATDELTKSLNEQREAVRKAYADGNIAGVQKAAIAVLSLKQQSDALIDILSRLKAGRFPLAQDVPCGS